MIARTGIAVFVSALAVASAGCGAGGTSLSGTVTYNDAPVEKGSITFSPTSGGTGFAAKIIDGKYVVDAELASGSYKATITGDRVTSIPKTREESAELEKQMRAKGQTNNYIPGDAEGNGQTVEIAAGSQTVDFGVKGPEK